MAVFIALYNPKNGCDLQVLCLDDLLIQYFNLGFPTTKLTFCAQIVFHWMSFFPGFKSNLPWFEGLVPAMTFNESRSKKKNSDVFPLDFLVKILGKIYTPKAYHGT